LEKLLSKPYLSFLKLHLTPDFHKLDELIHLYQKITTQGVVIIDDYGHFQGSQEATDKYFSQESQQVLFHRIDYSCRAGIKPATS
jgi:hypothetical protein